MDVFIPDVPCHPTELVYFRKRIGTKGVELILKESVNDDDKDKDNRSENIAYIDSTVQEKNITYPTDAKLHKKIISKCLEIADIEKLALRQSYKRTLKNLSRDQRFRNHPKNQMKAKKADGRIKTIAGRLVRELERNLKDDTTYSEEIDLFKTILSQKPGDKNKIYSINEPKVLCISKGKEHKKYEFGNKVSIIRSSGGVILGALSFRNEYDGHTIDGSLAQVKRLTDRRIDVLACDIGYKGQKQSGDTKIIIPSVPSPKDSYYQQKTKSKVFCSKAAIEPTIGHLKSDHRLSRNFYKGVFGDEINVMLAAIGYNFKRVCNVIYLFIYMYIIIEIYKKNSGVKKYSMPEMCF